jgi:hypothetical protein
MPYAECGKELTAPYSEVVENTGYRSRHREETPRPVGFGRAVVSHVVQSDDGRYRLGLHDDGPGFETRTFAASVLALQRPPPLIPESREATAANGGPSNLIADRSSHNNQPKDHSAERVRPQGQISPEGHANERSK